MLLALLFHSLHSAIDWKLVHNFVKAPCDFTSCNVQCFSCLSEKIQLPLALKNIKNLGFNSMSMSTDFHFFPCVRLGLESSVCYKMLLFLTHRQSLLHPQFPGWSQMDDGSIRVAEVTEDSLGTYTCMPYNALGSLGWSSPAPLVLKVHPKSLCIPHSKTAVRHYKLKATHYCYLTCVGASPWTGAS